MLHNAPVKQLATGFDWVEGPVWFGDAGCLLFSDIPNDRILRWIPGVGISVYAYPSNYANGHTRDREGRLVSCEHGTRRVTRTELDGSLTVIADRFPGQAAELAERRGGEVRRQHLVHRSHYGIASDYEGFRGRAGLPCHVYRVDPSTAGIEAC